MFFLSNLSMRHPATSWLPWFVKRDRRLVPLRPLCACGIVSLLLLSFLLSLGFDSLTTISVWISLCSSCWSFVSFLDGPIHALSDFRSPSHYFFKYLFCSFPSWNCMIHMLVLFMVFHRFIGSVHFSSLLFFLLLIRDNFTCPISKFINPFFCLFKSLSCYSECFSF